MGQVPRVRIQSKSIQDESGQGFQAVQNTKGLKNWSAEMREKQQRLFIISFTAHERPMRRTFLRGQNRNFSKSPLGRPAQGANSPWACLEVSEMPGSATVL